MTANRLHLAITAGIAAIILLIPCGSPEAQAPKAPEGLEIAVEAGAGGVIHVGRVNPFTILLKNGRDTDFHGAVEITNEGVSYRRTVDIAAGEASRVRLFVDLDKPQRDVSLFIKDARERTIYQAGIEIRNPAAPEDALVLVADSGSGLLSFMDGTPVLTAKKPVSEAEKSVLQQGKFMSAYTTLDNLLDAGPQYLAPVDALVLRDGDFSRISSENLAELQGFVAAGGALVVSGGANSPRVAQSKLAEILPFPQPSAEPVGDLSGLAAFGEAGITGRPLVLAGAGGSGVKKDAVAEASAGEIPLVAYRKYGLGRVVQFGFDAGDPSLRGWNGWERAWSKLLQPVLASPGANAVMLSAPAMAEMVKNLPQTDPIPIQTASLFILVYIVLVGPVNYALLARKKRRTLLWVSIPAVVVAFTVFGVLLGYFSRGTDNILRQIEEVHVFENVPVALVRSYTLDFPSASGEDSLAFSNASAVIRTVDPPPNNQRYGYYSYGQSSLTEISPRKISYAPVPSVTRRSNKWTPYLTWWDGIAEAKFGSLEIGGGGKSLEYSFPEIPSRLWLGKDIKIMRLEVAGATGSAPINPGFYSASPSPPAGRRSLDYEIDAAVHSITRPLMTGKLQPDTLTAYAYFKLGKAEIETSRKYRQEAGRLVAYHFGKLPDSREFSAKNITVTGFKSKSGTPGRSRSLGYGGLYEEQPIVLLNEGDEIEFEIVVSNPESKIYGLTVYASQQDRWSSDGPPDFEYIVETSSGTHAQGKATEKQSVEVSHEVFADGKVWLKITAVSKLALNSITFS